MIRRVHRRVLETQLCAVLSRLFVLVDFFDFRSQTQTNTAQQQDTNEKSHISYLTAIWKCFRRSQPAAMWLTQTVE